MKKVIKIIIYSLFIPTLVFAGGSSDDTTVDPGESITATCVYKNDSTYTENGKTHTKTEFSKFQFSGIDGTTYTSSGGAVAIKEYYKIDNSDNSTELFKVELNGDNHILNYNKDLNTKYAITMDQSNIYYENNSSEEKLKTAYKNGYFCPSTVFTFKEGNTYKYMFCDGYNNTLDVNTCTNVQNYLTKNYPGVTFVKKGVTSETAISNVGKNDYSNTDVEEVYTEEKNLLEELCDPESEKYDPTECGEQKEIVDTIVEQAEDQGITEKELEVYRSEAVKSPTLEEIENCTSLLGSPDTKPNGDTPGSPAYYLSVAFSVLRYIAIAILIVMSVMDFIQATSAQDDDAIKKAVAKTTKRLIMCVIIFVLPILIQFLLEFVHNQQTDLCGIGKVN